MLKSSEKITIKREGLDHPYCKEKSEKVSSFVKGLFLFLGKRKIGARQTDQERIKQKEGVSESLGAIDFGIAGDGGS